MKNNYFILTCFMMLFFAGIATAQKGFIKIGDIEGEAVEATHRNWIVIESFNQTLEKQTSAGTTRRSVAPTMTRVVFTKKIDKSTPKLMESCAKGQVHPKVEMEMTSGSERGAPQTFYMVTLENVLITGVNSSGLCSPDCEVMEEVALSFTKISWEHTDSSGQKVEANYDLERER
ncbi:type VI secretion system tube protein Hcp [Flavobacteriaceae bacterium TP-CH-4]|uniref:Type VI secretion system tube protein Hcp n=1 Tax=Pelagihabitans pacificus TaxID=2696054 RepID=A0A967APM5_9FLAO|nr:type VI secretion system tube protein Hcp [Pelagihabitans pacificus]NHF58116.1 type VI secretion system tube protein Hcp [Pelagihabitans pacificus]